MANSENNNVNTTQPIPQPINNLNPASINFAQDFAERFMDSYVKFVQKSSGANFYNPLYSNNAMKRFNTLPTRPTEANIIAWLNNPRYFEKQLMACSDFLYWSVMQYQRSVVHFASLLNFSYELIPLNPPSLNSSKKVVDLYLKQRAKNNEWLRKFRVKEQCPNVMIDVMRSGGKFYYLRESEEGNSLMTLPDDFMTIDGKTDYGFTTALNMTFFKQFPNAMSGFAPEFAEWYKIFLDSKSEQNINANPYRPLPYDKAVVFKFDDNRPEIVPPLSGTFKDGIQIQDYKDLLKLSAELQTYQIMYLKAPLDESGKPTMSSQEIINYVSLAQTLVPPGTGVISTPMDMENAKFTNAQNMNNIVGTSEQQFWSSVGIAGGIYGMDTKSAIALKLSVQADYNYIKHMYNQFERFINLQLSKIVGKYNFEIHFLRRSEFFLEDDKKSALSFAQSGGQPERLLASYDYEPYEMDNVLIDSLLNKTRSMMIPLQSSFTTSGKVSNDKGGAPKKSDSELGQSGADTRGGGYNENDKFSLIHKCKNCDVPINITDEFAPFCSDSCIEEYFLDRE